MALQICGDPFCPNIYEILKLEAEVERLKKELEKTVDRLKEYEDYD